MILGGGILQFILGSSGSGKSYEMYKQVIELSILHPDKNFIVIVPEQFTMQTQKDIVCMHPNKGVMNIDIVSFTRLAYRVFEEVGGYNQLVLEDIGKSMVLRKVVELKKKELGVFSANIKKIGFVNELKSLLSELYQYNIDNEKLLQAVSFTEKKPLLNSKLKDISTIYNGFNEFLSDRFITAEEILDLLSVAIVRSESIKNSYIFLDGFTGFTPSQYKLLEQLMKFAIHIKIALTIDPRENMYKVEEEFKLFYMTQKTIDKLLKIAHEIGIAHEQDLVLKDAIPVRFKEAPTLASLEKNIFRFPYKTYEQAQDNIYIQLAKNPNEEVEFVASQIISLVRDEKYRYKDIAVVTGDIKMYSNVVDTIFGKNNIPCFTDNKRSILSNPFIELIRSALEILIKDFSYESVFRYLRCGLTDIATEDVDVLENYVLACGIRGSSMWQKVWNRKYRNSGDIDFDKLNTIRQSLMDEILPLGNLFKDKTLNIMAYTEGLWNFITKLNIEHKLETYRIQFNENNEFVLAKQYEQIYKMVVTILDKIVEILGEECIDCQEYLGILEAGFEEAKMGLIPPGIDQVVFGDIERTRLKDIKALFFIGVNDGIIPKPNNRSGIISDMEKQILLDNGIELAPTARQNVYTEKFYLYSNLTKPQCKLYISFSKVGLNGKALRASYLIGTIKKLFPKIEIVDEEQINPLALITNKASGLKVLIEGLRDYKDQPMTTQWKELFNFYYTDKAMQQQLLQLIDAVFYVNKEQGLSKAVSNALYGKELVNSVTRLEQYAACAYAHFLSYGLELLERQKHIFSAPDLGNIFHSTIELFSKKLLMDEQDWRSISDAQRDALEEQCVYEVTQEYGESILSDSARNQYMINRINRISKRTIWALQQHLKKGSFLPSKYEVGFASYEDLDAINIALSEDEKLKLKGRIDRLDQYEDEENVYVKVIDYKSGSTQFDMVALYYGLQLQLVVYMNAAVELEGKKTEKNVIPAGIFYYNINDPIVDKKSNEVSEINQMLLKELKLNGLVNNEANIIKLLDKDFDGSSEVYPIKQNKDGKLNAAAASSEQFKELSTYVNKKIKLFGTEILSGNISVNPYKIKDDTACTYCKYNAICGFELNSDSQGYRKFKEYNTEQVWKLIEQDLGKEEN
jgi:ATP-dependent helicase/nuclease subunit B